MFSAERNHLNTLAFPTSNSTVSTLTLATPTMSLQSFSEWKRKVKCTTGVTTVSENIIDLLAKVSPKSVNSRHFSSLNKPTESIISSSKSENLLLSLSQNQCLFVPPLYSHHLDSSNIKSNEHSILQYGKSNQYRYTPLQADYYLNSIPTTVNSYPADSWAISGTVRPTPEFQPAALNATQTTSSYICNPRILNCEVSKINNVFLQPDKTLASFPWQQSKFAAISSATTSAGKPAMKKCSTGPRKNVWKNQTYADFICKAILSSPAKKLTLSQIYDWLTENIDYFKTKKEGKSSVGWKNSIRHNLSLHSRFVRMQGNESGKSSWWTVDLSAKSSRRKSRKALENMAAKRSAKNSGDVALAISNRLKDLPLRSPQTQSGHPHISYSVSTSSIPSLYSTINGNMQTGYNTGTASLTRAKNSATTGYKEKSSIDMVPYCCNSPYQFSCPTTQSCCYSNFFPNSTPTANSETFYYTNNNSTNSNDINLHHFTYDKNDLTTANCCRYPSQYIGSDGYDCYPYFGSTAFFPFFSDSASSCILHSFSKNDFENSKTQPSIIPSTYSYPDCSDANFSDFGNLHAASQGLDAYYYGCYPNHCCYEYHGITDHSFRKAADKTPALNGSVKNQGLDRLQEDCLVISVMK